MTAKALRPDPARAGAFASGPRPAGLGVRLVLAAALAATLSLGAERPLAMLCLLLGAVSVALGSLSCAIALVRREALRPGI